MTALVKTHSTQTNVKSTKRIAGLPFLYKYLTVTKMSETKSSAKKWDNCRLSPKGMNGKRLVRKTPLPKSYFYQYIILPKYYFQSLNEKYSQMHLRNQGRRTLDIDRKSSHFYQRIYLRLYL